MATRGRESNRLYVDTAYDPNVPTGHEEVTETGPVEVLEGVIRTSGAELSATATRQAEQEAAHAEWRLMAEGAAAARARFRSGARREPTDRRLQESTPGVSEDRRQPAGGRLDIELAQGLMTESIGRLLRPLGVEVLLAAASRAAARDGPARQISQHPSNPHILCPISEGREQRSPCRRTPVPGLNWRVQRRRASQELRQEGLGLRYRFGARSMPCCRRSGSHRGILGFAPPRSG